MTVTLHNDLTQPNIAAVRQAVPDTAGRRPLVLTTAALAATFLVTQNSTAPVGAFPVRGVPQPDIPGMPPGMKIAVPDQIVRDLMQFPMISFAVAFAVVGVAAAWFSGLFGKRMLVWSLLAFAVVTAAATIDGGDNWMGITRIVQGIAAAVVLVSSLVAALRESYVETARVTALGWVVVALAAVAAGPFITMFLMSHREWSADRVLWTQVGLAVALTVAVWWSMPRHTLAEAHTNALVVPVAAVAGVAGVAAALSLYHPSAHIAAVTVIAGVPAIAGFAVVWSQRSAARRTI